jgi:hypothetical protein
VHGKLVEREGGIQLTPAECDDWAQEIEDEYAALLCAKNMPTTAAGQAARELLDVAARKVGKVIIKANTKTKRGRR